MNTSAAWKRYREARLRVQRLARELRDAEAALRRAQREWGGQRPRMEPVAGSRLYPPPDPADLD